jgi:hypothetical protein
MLQPIFIRKGRLPVSKVAVSPLRWLRPLEGRILRALAVGVRQYSSKAIGKKVQRCGVTPHRIEGPAKDGRLIQVICRFKADGDLMIITVYALTEDV